MDSASPEYPLKLIVYTDLNDTLLDRNYSFDSASEALELLKKYDIPLILCTSKTRGQTEIYRRQLGIVHPLIVENGGAVYFPRDSFPTGRLPSGSVHRNGEWIFKLSTPAADTLKVLKDTAAAIGAEIETVFEMETSRIREITGMTPEECELAKQREYSVYFLCHSGKDALFTELRRKRLKPTWGSYFCHVSAYTDKGIAAHKLTALYRELGYSDFYTAAFGDNMNDLTLFQTVDRAFLVERPEGGYAPGIEVPGLEKIPGVGPAGWNRKVIELVVAIDWGI